jgi:hypothetical protein
MDKILGTLDNIKFPAGKQYQQINVHAHTVEYRQTPIFRHPFYRQQCFSLKYVLGTPSNFLEVCLNSKYM